MNKSKHLTVVFIFVAMSTGLMLFDYASMMPTATLSILPWLYGGFFAALGLAHVFDLIKQYNTKD